MLEFKMYDVVKLQYKQEDLENEDLGMSGIVLESPLNELMNLGFLNETFYYMGTLLENANFCYIALKLNDKPSKRHYKIYKDYLVKVEE